MNGMVKLYFTVHVNLQDSIRTESAEAAGEELVAYVRYYGVTAGSVDDALELIARDVKDGTVDSIRGGEVDLDSLDTEIRKRAISAGMSGIWHRSGRILIDESQRRDWG